MMNSYNYEIRSHNYDKSQKYEIKMHKYDNQNDEIKSHNYGIKLKL